MISRSVVAAPALAALAVVAVAASGAGVTTAIAAVHACPERLIDDDAGLLHRLGRLVRALAQVGDAVVIRRLVVDEPAVRDLLAEHRVLTGVQDERVPADVHEGRWAEVTSWLLGSQLEVAEGLVEDALCELAGHLLVLHDATDETLRELLLDHGQVHERNARGRHHDGACCVRHDTLLVKLHSACDTSGGLPDYIDNIMIIVYVNNILIKSEIFDQ